MTPMQRRGVYNWFDVAGARDCASVGGTGGIMGYCGGRWDGHIRVPFSRIVSMKAVRYPGWQRPCAVGSYR